MAEYIRKIFFISPLKDRPDKSAFTAKFLIAYDPEKTESYLMYKAYIFSTYITIASIIIFTIAAFLGSEYSVTNQLKYDFPKFLGIPLIIASCVYVIAISWINRKKHDWNFSGTRPAYLKNLERIKKQRFVAPLKLVLIHFLFPTLLLICVPFSWAPFDAWDLYLLTSSINRFDQDTVINFFIIAMMYFWMLPCIAINFIAFIILLFFEKVYSVHTKLIPIFRRK